MADVRLEDMEVGKTFYWVKWGGEIAEIRVISALFERHMIVENRSKDQLERFFPGDNGVLHAAYDRRVTQVFFTHNEALKARVDWAGRNPNFIYKD